MTQQMTVQPVDRSRTRLGTRKEDASMLVPILAFVGVVLLRNVTGSESATAELRGTEMSA